MRILSRRPPAPRPRSSLLLSDRRARLEQTLTRRAGIALDGSSSRNRSCEGAPLPLEAAGPRWGRATGTHPDPECLFSIVSTPFRCRCLLRRHRPCEYHQPGGLLLALLAHQSSKDRPAPPGTTLAEADAGSSASTDASRARGGRSATKSKALSSRLNGSAVAEEHGGADRSLRQGETGLQKEVRQQIEGGLPGASAAGRVGIGSSRWAQTEEETSRIGPLNQ